MAATQRAGRMRGKRVLLSQAIRSQNIRLVVAMDRLMEESQQKDALLEQRDEMLEERNIRIDMLLGDLRRAREVKGHSRAYLAIVAPQELEA